MKLLFVLAFSLMNAVAWGQVTPAPATPKKDPFAGFGNALDRRPSGTRMAATPSVVSELPTAGKGLSFDARSISNGGSVKTSQSSSATGLNSSLQSTQTQENRVTVEMQVHNFGAAPAQAHFDWFFVAKPVRSVQTHGVGQTQNPGYVWDRGQKDIAVAAGTDQKEVFQSSGLTQVEQQTTQTQATGFFGGPGLQYQNQISAMKSSSGARPYGWIIRLLDGDRVMQVRASSSDLETIGSDPAQMAALLQRGPNQLLPMTPKPMPTPPARR